MEKTIGKFSVNITIYEKNTKKKWFNKQLEVVNRRKNKIKYNIAKSLNNYEAWNEYKRTRNLYKTKLEQEKSNYINKTRSNSNDLKQMWNTIKDLM